MIVVDKHTNLDFTVINVTAFIIQKLNIKGELGYDELLEEINITLGERAETNYPYALNFLFLLGKVQYIEKNDSIRLNEA